MPIAKMTSSKFQVYLDGDKFWELLENGRDTDLLYPDHFKTEIVDEQYHEYMRGKLLEGEEYVLLDDVAYDYAITSFGRIFNCIYDTQVKVYFSKEDALMIIRTYKTKMSKEFEKYGWDFDLETIRARYKKYKWGTRRT